MTSAETAPPNGGKLLGANLSILHGKDGWLFLKEGEQFRPVALYSGEITVSPAVWRAWRGIAQARIEFCAKANTDVIHLVSPDAHWVYQDRLPPGIELHFRPADHFRAALAGLPGATVIDPLKVLRAGRGPFETYIQTDTHWTQYGAYLAYRELMSALDPRHNVQVVQEADLGWEMRRQLGDLGVLAEPEQFSMVPVAKLLRPRARLVREVRGINRNLVLQEFRQPGEAMPSCIIFRDSFGSALLPFLKESFGRLIAVSYGGMISDLIESVRPDVIVFQRVERALMNLPKDAAARLQPYFRISPQDLAADAPLAVRANAVPAR